MFTTRIISVQYHLLLLFDMRPKTGMFERKNRKTLSRKVRTKLLDSPGGFEIEVPIVIATVSDPTLEAQPKPWTQLRSSPNEVDTSLATAAASQLSLGLSATSSPSLSASPSPLSPYATLPGQYPFPSTLAAQNGRNSEPDSPVFTPRTQYHANAATIGHASQWRASPDRRAATDPGYQSLSKASSSSSLNYEGFSKPLPTIPSSSRPTPTLTPSTHSTFTSQAALFAVHTQAHDVSSGTASTTAQIQLPQSLPYQSASAPSAVDLGLGSASPAPSHQQLRYLNSLSFSQFGSASEGSGSGSSFRAGAASSGNGQPPRLEYRLSRVPDIKTGSAAMRLIQRSAGAPQVPDSANQSWSAHTLYQTTSPVDMSAQRPQQQQQHYMPHPQRHGQHGASTYSSSSSQPSQFQPQTQYQPSHAVNNNRNSHIDGSDSDPVPPYSAVSL
ncbi:hypothetical protein BGZ83_001011 [Gryganskiella cystojenkinii]|nr:hypothetical protein BGZ83_001011 [Gryganskiella cystojenkinii]